MMSQVRSHSEGKNPDSKKTNSPSIEFSNLVEQQENNQKNQQVITEKYCKKGRIFFQPNHLLVLLLN